MLWVSVALGIACIILLVLRLVAVRQVKSLSRQLRAMKDKPFENMILRLDEGSGKYKNLVIEMNTILDTLRSFNRKLFHQRQLFKSQISSISHDLRTPLTSIMGYLELAKEEQSLEKRNEYLEIVVKRSKILQTLIVDFYDLTRLEDEEYQLHCEPLLIDSILENSILTFYHDFLNKGIELKINIVAGTKVLAARQELVRVYTNLLQNILKHGSKNAQIQHYERDGRVFTLFSNDFETDKKFEPKRMFERFYTGNASRHDQSTGLGLYTVRLLLEKMGHSISAETTDERLTIMIEYGA